ncbi:hypothetical protein EVAR_18048_1 [Eumeta japonica]|uniref:Uncharacterized protein n=1 Tax=Eumeta variegata TaxID=151549 RepID=A0A4C1XSE4_EUMVA|nr:hypothetical protein EVAR_18048_1 [Eumeta japonica]
MAAYGGGGMADQKAIHRRANHSLPAHGRTGEACYSPEQSCAKHGALRTLFAPGVPSQTCSELGLIHSWLIYMTPSWEALCSTFQRKRIQIQQNIALRMIVGAGWYVLNDVIARDLDM